MDNDLEKYHDQIDAYIRDELSNGDRLLFEKSLEQDQQLKEELLIHKELFVQGDDISWVSRSFVSSNKDVKELETYFRSDEAQNLKSIIADARNNYRLQKRKPVSVTKWFFPILAAACIVLVVTIYNYNSTHSSEYLYAMYNDWDNMPSLTSRSGNDLLSKGQELFQDGNYEKSYDFFKNSILDTDDISPSVLIYLGLSSLEIEKYQEAVLYFDQLINSDAIDRSQGYWYKALVYLKQDKTNETKQVLEELILDTENYKYAEAIALLKKIE